MKSCATDISRSNSRTAADTNLEMIVIGYGNTLRSDDGVGPAVVEWLRSRFAGNPHFLCLSYHQLVPELVIDLSGAKRLLFVDASAKVPPGKIQVRRIIPAEWQSGRSFHTCSPEAILGLVQEFYGRAPDAWTLAIGVADLSFGEDLSPTLKPVAQRLVRHLAYHIHHWIPPTKTKGAHPVSANGHSNHHPGNTLRRRRAMERD